jgi:hypothetical protein
VELSVKAGVKHLCLFHSDSTYGDERLDQYQRDAREYLTIYNDGQSHWMRIDVAYDGMVVKI